jgi:hypothetical protein
MYVPQFHRKRPAFGQRAEKFVEIGGEVAAMLLEHGEARSL